MINIRVTMNVLIIYDITVISYEYKREVARTDEHRNLYKPTQTHAHTQTDEFGRGSYMGGG